MKINEDLLSKYIFDIEEIHREDAGFYIKFKNGFILQSKRIVFRVNVSLWANGTYYQDIEMGNWLVPFVYNANDSYSFYPIFVSDYFETPASQGSAQLWVGPCDSLELVKAGKVRGCRPDNAFNALNVDFAAVRVAFGRWK